jgi:very-short-patch-repair endonuclease
VPEVQGAITRPDVRVAELAARERGVLTTGELHSCGLDDHAILTRVRNGQLHRRFTGVYAVGYAVLCLEACFLAAVKACGPDAVLSHYSAAVLHGLLEWDGRAPEVTTRTVRKHPGLRAHRAKTLERCYVKGIPVTPVLRTIIDLAGSRLPGRQLRRAVNEALNQRAIRLGDLITGDHRGARRLRAILASAAPTTNEFEDVVLAIITQGRLPDPEVGRWYLGFRPDFRWPEQRVIVEADGKRTHDQALARADDATRQAVFEAHGETVLRVTWREATTRPKETLRRIRAALDARRVMAVCA